MSNTKEPTITLYTSQTPNGHKISILLEELGLPYKVHKVDMKNGEQKQEKFLKINPNGRIPAITDADPHDPSKTIRVFESGSIMQYLVDRYDKEHRFSYPAGSLDHIEMTSWLFFMNSGVGPMQGQSNHFTRYCPEDIPYARDRYQHEVKRLYGVLEERLREIGGPYIMGDKCTIADIAHWGWVGLAPWAGVELEPFKLLKAWEERMWARPALKRGADVPDKYTFKELLNNREEMAEKAKAGMDIIQKGMKEDRDRNAQRESKV